MVARTLFRLNQILAEITPTLIPPPLNQQLMQLKDPRFWPLKSGSLSNDEGDAKDDAYSKMNLYFTCEFRNCLDLFRTPMALKTCSG